MIAISLFYCCEKVWKNFNEKSLPEKKDFYSKIVSNLGIYYTWKNIKESCKNNKFKIRAPTWNEIFELLEGSYLVSDIQNCFEYILKKHGEKADTPSIKKYINKIENRITFKIKAGYYLIQLLTPETIKLLISNKSKITKDKNGENVPRLEIFEVRFKSLVYTYSK